jgi:hypothetical protein
MRFFKLKELTDMTNVAAAAQAAVNAKRLPNDHYVFQETE